MISPIIQRLGAAVVDAHGNLYDHDGNPGQLQVGQHGPAGSTNWHPAARHAPELPKIYRPSQIQTLTWKITCPETITMWGANDETYPPGIQANKTWRVHYNPYAAIAPYFPWRMAWYPLAATDRGLAFGDQVVFSDIQLFGAYEQWDRDESPPGFRHDPLYFAGYLHAVLPREIGNEQLFGYGAIAATPDAAGSGDDDWWYVSSQEGIAAKQQAGVTECVPEFMLEGVTASGKAYYFMGNRADPFALPLAFVLRGTLVRRLRLGATTHQFTYIKPSISGWPDYETPPATIESVFAAYLWTSDFGGSWQWRGHLGDIPWVTRTSEHDHNGWKFPTSVIGADGTLFPALSDTITESSYSVQRLEVKEGETVTAYQVQVVTEALGTMTLEFSSTGTYALTGFDQENPLTGTYRVTRRPFWVVDLAHSKTTIALNLDADPTQAVDCHATLPRGGVLDGVTYNQWRRWLETHDVTMCEASIDLLEDYAPVVTLELS